MLKVLHNRKGFTLMQTLAVLALSSIIITLGSNGAVNAIKSSREVTTESDMHLIMSDLETTISKTGGIKRDIDSAVFKSNVTEWLNLASRDFMHAYIDMATLKVSHSMSRQVSKAKVLLKNEDAWGFPYQLILSLGEGEENYVVLLSGGANGRVDLNEYLPDKDAEELDDIILLLRVKSNSYEDILSYLDDF